MRIRTAIFVLVITATLSGGAFLYRPTTVLAAASTFDLTLSTPEATDSTLTFTATPVNFTDWRGYYCIGASSVCSPQPTSNTLFWKSIGLKSGPVTILVTGLRPGRSYTITMLGFPDSDSTNKKYKETSASILWPGYQSPTDLNLQTSNVTDNSADLSWSTPFLGDTRISYSQTAPFWNLQSSSVSGPSALAAIGAAGTGEAWSVGFGGKILYRPGYSASDQTWVAQASPTTNFLSSISVFDSSNVWAAGFQGTVIRTTDGQNWVSVNPGGTTGFNGIDASSPSNAWVVGDSGNVYYYNSAAAWQSRSNSTIGTTNLYSVASHGNVVWIGGASGKIFRSIDNGVSWQASTLPTGLTVKSIATLDGQTVWAGSGSKVFVSSNAGSTWSQMFDLGANTITTLVPISTNEFWINNDSKIVHWYQGNTENFPQPYSIIGTYIAAMTVVNGTEVMVAGQQLRIAHYSLCDNACTGVITDSGPNMTQSHTFSITAPQLNPGTKYYFTALSTNGTVSSGTFGTFTTTAPDNEPPQINITTPSGTPTYTNQAAATIAGDASDNARLTSITLTNNGAGQTVNTTPTVPVQAPNATTRASLTWTSSVNLQPGTNNLVATASDGSLTSSDTSANATIIYDNEAPTVTIATPQNGATVTSATIGASGTAQDTIDEVASLQYQLNGGVRQNISGPGGKSVSWSASLNLAVGSNTLTVFAKDRAGNEGSATVTFTYAEPYFKVTATPASQTKNAGDVVTYDITVTSFNDYTGSVNLSASGNPGGSTVNFNPATVTLAANGTATSQLTITTNTITTGTFTITIIGTDGTKSDQTTVQLILNSFSLSASPSSRSIVGGQSTTYQITASGTPQFSGDVAFTITSLTDTTPTFAPGTVTLSPSATTGASNLTIQTLATAPAGNHTLVVTGTSGSLVKTVPITLNISAPPDIDLTVAPSPQNVTAGKTAGFNGNATAVNGYSELTNITTTVTPSDPNMTFSITPTQFVPAGGSGTGFVINVTTTSATKSGPYTITVKAANAADTVSKSVDVTLQVDPDTTPPVISNVVATPNWNSVRIAWETDEPANSMITLYTDPSLSLASLVGTVSDPQFCTAGCHDLAYQPQNPNDPYLTPLTTYYFTVTSADQDTNDPLPTPNVATAKTQSDGVTPLQFTTLDEPDTTPPTVSISAPAAGDQITGAQDITGDAADNKNMAKVNINIIEQGNSTAVLDRNIDCTGLTCTYTTSWSTTSLNNGTYTITAIATDAAGNKSTSFSIQVTVYNDTTYPQLTCGDVKVDASAVPNTLCGKTECWQATISWCTDDQATTEVEYGTTVNCSAYPCTYPNTVYADPNNINALSTTHQITLTDLDANTLYHYRISTCNISGLCTH